MSKIDWSQSADLPVGQGATRQEFDAKVGTDQLAIETTRWATGTSESMVQRLHMSTTRRRNCRYFRI
jgi:hypothetical protein